MKNFQAIIVLIYSASNDNKWSYLGFTTWKSVKSPASNPDSAILIPNPTIMKFFWSGFNYDQYQTALGYSGRTNPAPANLEEWFNTNIGYENNFETSTDHAVIRYAEVLLMYAEANAKLSELGGSADLNDAIEKLNWVRRRAYAGGLPAVKDTIANAIADGTLSTEYWKRATPAVDYPQAGETDLVKAIVAERSYEFIGEIGGVRWFDLTRLEMVEEALSTRDNRELSLIGSADDTKQWRMPIPADEIVKNPNLEIVIE